VVSVEPLGKDDVEASARVLASAFRDNPGMLAIIPDRSDEERERVLVPCMRGFIASVIRYGVAEVVREQGTVVAVSLSFRPGEFPPPFYATVMQAGGPIRAGLRATLRFARVDHEMRKRHPHYRHWYLWFLGVARERQGRGLGSILLRALSARANADGVPCYLETDKPTSVKLYERHAYRVESEGPLPPLGFQLWYMKRPAHV
jgi:ribosomal protein S18 acetylase RimI-like enzyme